MESAVNITPKPQLHSGSSRIQSSPEAQHSLLFKSIADTEDTSRHITSQFKTISSSRHHRSIDHSPPSLVEQFKSTELDSAFIDREGRLPMSSPSPSVNGSHLSPGSPLRRSLSYAAEQASMEAIVPVSLDKDKDREGSTPNRSRMRVITPVRRVYPEHSDHSSEGEESIE
eukprot:gnl/Dysnectes_brevis/1570_a1780_2371.p1 GENE.gnl/Dysnectes_brevis/1570_a1780_2371~~gnl/Dysnectes_brevis/1570_a1780_2371.p1  ORF type:complete len:171 (+),score=14.95 gnl/Dysnectes_brevis/1570_a1780_2371:110-622(+)